MFSFLKEKRLSQLKGRIVEIGLEKWLWVRSPTGQGRCKSVWTLVLLSLDAFISVPPQIHMCLSHHCTSPTHFFSQMFTTPVYLVNFGLTLSPQRRSRQWNNLELRLWNQIQLGANSVSDLGGGKIIWASVKDLKSLR